MKNQTSLHMYQKFFRTLKLLEPKKYVDNSNDQLYLLIGFITGHYRPGKSLIRMRSLDTDECRLCGLYAFASQRRQCFGSEDYMYIKKQPPNSLSVWLEHPQCLFSSFTGIHNNIVRIAFKYGPNFVVWLFNEVIMMVGKPEDVETILQSPWCVEKNGMYNFTREIVGNGLFSAPSK